MPGAGIFIKNSKSVAISDRNGYYQISLKPGKQTLIIKMMGYQTIEKNIDASVNSKLKFDTTLNVNAKVLNEAVISSDKRSLAKSIIQEMKDKRKDYLDSIQNYECTIYRKISLENTEPKMMKDSVEKTRNDSISGLPEENRRKKKKNKAFRKDTNTQMVQYISSLNETIALLYYEKPAKYKESVIAENPYQIKWPREMYYISMNMSEGTSFHTNGYEYSNPYNLINNAATADFNFYKSTLIQPSICIKPLLSPLASGSALSYKYDYEGVVYEEGKKYYKIKITPIFPADALYSGYIVVQDSSWSLHAVDLAINPDVLLYCKNFRIQQSYKLLSPGISVPEKSVFTFTIKEGNRTIQGSTEIIYSDYSINQKIPSQTFTSEIKEYQENALDKDSVWWTQYRPNSLTDNEYKFDRKIDSLSAYYNSDEYIFKTDSTVNHIDIWNVVYEGITHVNRNKQTMVFITPLLMQVNPFGIGGYRHNLGVVYAKRFSNDFLFETEQNINFGFANSDIRGKAGFGLTYVPKKSVRTFIRFGDYYSMVNTNASISSIISRSNYARTKTASISQRMELINGLFGELTFTYSDQTPINNMKMDPWSNEIFGEINKPLEFTRYIKSELQLELVYKPFQKYVMKKNRKIILGSSWPELSFMWRKGIPHIFNSEVNFDYVEAGIRDEMKLARWGRFSWQVLGGSFVNKKNLKLLEYKYFRGSDKIFFSSPVRSLQLLGPTLSSSSAFFQFNCIHHFEGSITDKIPFMSRLKLGLAVGGGGLWMEENSFRHGEVFGGIERVFRIRRQLFRLGLFAVTSDNNINKADFTFKIGINMYNSYSRKWDY